MSGAIRIDEGEDYLRKFQRYKRTKWWKRIGIVTWLGIVLFMLVALFVVLFVGMWAWDYIALNGFSFNPFSGPNRGTAVNMVR